MKRSACSFFLLLSFSRVFGAEVTIDWTGAWVGQPYITGNSSEGVLMLSRELVVSEGFEFLAFPIRLVFSDETSVGLWMAGEGPIPCVWIHYEADVEWFADTDEAPTFGEWAWFEMPDAPVCASHRSARSSSSSTFLSTQTPHSPPLVFGSLTFGMASWCSFCTEQQNS